MAGCEPAHLPVVLAAVEAVAEPEFNLRGVQTTDENVTPLLILSSPDCAALEVDDGFGALGPGWRGNAFVAGLSSQAIVRIELDGDAEREVERYDMGARIRGVFEGPDGAIWALGDGTRGGTGDLLKLTPKN